MLYVAISIVFSLMTTQVCYCTLTKLVIMIMLRFDRGNVITD